MSKCIDPQQRYYFNRFIQRREFFGYGYKVDHNTRRQLLLARDILEKQVNENASNYHHEPSNSYEKLCDLVTAIDELIYPANRKRDEFFGEGEK